MSRLIGSSLYNLGLCSFAEEAYEKAAEYFKEELEYTRIMGMSTQIVY